MHMKPIGLFLLFSLFVLFISSCDFKKTPKDVAEEYCRCINEKTIKSHMDCIEQLSNKYDEIRVWYFEIGDSNLSSPSPEIKDKAATFNIEFVDEIMSKCS